MQQGYAMRYVANSFIFSSNGEGFLFHNNIAINGVIEREIALDEFPSPETLWNMMMRTGLSPTQVRLITQIT